MEFALSWPKIPQHHQNSPETSTNVSWRARTRRHAGKNGGQGMQMLVANCGKCTGLQIHSRTRKVVQRLRDRNMGQPCVPDCSRLFQLSSMPLCLNSKPFTSAHLSLTDSGMIDSLSRQGNPCSHCFKTVSVEPAGITEYAWICLNWKPIHTAAMRCARCTT